MNKKKAKAKGAVKNKQHAEFVRTARALGCDESEASFDKALKKIGKAKPESKPKKKTHA